MVRVYGRLDAEIDTPSDLRADTKWSIPLPTTAMQNMGRLWAVGRVNLRLRLVACRVRVVTRDKVGIIRAMRAPRLGTVRSFGFSSFPVFCVLVFEFFFLYFQT